MTKSRWESSSEDEKEDNSSNHKNSSKKQKRSDEDNSNTIESCKCKSPINKNKDHSESSGLSNLKPPLITEYKPLFHGCRDVENYQRLNFIDQGTYGMVFKARCRETGEKYALKQVKLDAGVNINKQGFPITALRETNILLALNHPNIVKVKEMVVGSSTDKIFMVMELGDADMKTCMEMSSQPFSTGEVKQLMLQFLSAVTHIHENWFIHRDLKTSNLLYSNSGKLSVCDFGMARKFGSPIVPYSPLVVTLWYRAPEILLGSSVYSTPLDIWSVGCIFAEFINRKPLFPGQGEIDQISQIFKILGAPNETIWPGYSSLPHAGKITSKSSNRNRLKDLFPSTSFSGGFGLSELGFDLLCSLLTFDPSQRISASDALNHKWFQESPLPASPNNMPKFDFKEK